MRIGNQGDTAMQASKNPTLVSKVEVPKSEVPKLKTSETIQKTVVQAKNETEQKDDVSKHKLKEAVESINEFLHTQQKSSKFVFHEGLDKYYVKLVDAETDEVIKEIPPERLLNAFYEMQKMAGMIVDEKI